jgi:hypothetical protein
MKRLITVTFVILGLTTLAITTTITNENNIPVDFEAKGPCAYNLDFNCNGCVSVEDLLLLLAAVGSIPNVSPNTCGSSFDLDIDGDIDKYDVMIFKDNYNSCAGC